MQPIEITIHDLRKYRVYLAGVAPGGSNDEQKKLDKSIQIIGKAIEDLEAVVRPTPANIER